MTAEQSVRIEVKRKERKACLCEASPTDKEAIEQGTKVTVVCKARNCGTDNDKIYVEVLKGNSIVAGFKLKDIDAGDCSIYVETTGTFIMPEKDVTLTFHWGHYIPGKIEDGSKEHTIKTKLPLSEPGMIQCIYPMKSTDPEPNPFPNLYYGNGNKLIHPNNWPDDLGIISKLGHKKEGEYTVLLYSEGEELPNTFEVGLYRDGTKIGALKKTGTFEWTYIIHEDHHLSFTEYCNFFKTHDYFPGYDIHKYKVTWDAQFGYSTGETEEYPLDVGWFVHDATEIEAIEEICKKGAPLSLTKQDILNELASRGPIPCEKIPRGLRPGGGWHQTGPCELEYLHMYEVDKKFTMSIFADVNNPPASPYDISWDSFRGFCATSCPDETFIIEGEAVCKHCKATIPVTGLIMDAVFALYALTPSTIKACLVYATPHANLFVPVGSIVNVNSRVSNCSAVRGKIKARVWTPGGIEEKEGELDPKEEIELTYSFTMPDKVVGISFYAMHWDETEKKWITDETNRFTLVNELSPITPKKEITLTTNIPIELYYCEKRSYPNPLWECRAFSQIPIMNYPFGTTFRIALDRDAKCTLVEISGIESGKVTKDFNINITYPTCGVPTGWYAGTSTVDIDAGVLDVFFTTYPELKGSVDIAKSIIPHEIYLTKPSTFQIHIENTSEVATRYKITLAFTGIDIAKEYMFTSEWSETINPKESTKLDVEVTLPKDAIPTDKEEATYDIQTHLEAKTI